MHGLIFAGLKKYTDAKLGPEAWQGLLEEAGMGDRLYLANEVYSDDELVTLVVTASRITGIPVPALLEDYGEFIGTALVDMYSMVFKREWRTMDILEHVEHTAHRAVRIRNAGSTPPVLESTRNGPNKVTIVYRSERKLCAVAKGMAKGVARHFDERVRVDEPACMTKGSPCCRIEVTLAA